MPSEQKDLLARTRPGPAGCLPRGYQRSVLSNRLWGQRFPKTSDTARIPAG